MSLFIKTRVLYTLGWSYGVAHHACSVVCVKDALVVVLFLLAVRMVSYSLQFNCANIVSFD